jgi:TonB family protein
VSGFSFLTSILSLGIVLTGSPIKCLPQTGGNAKTLQGKVVLRRLAQLSYPPVARQTRVTGDVELMLGVKEDGSVQSATVISGHPLLKQAALDSAQRSEFNCRNCEQGVRSFHIEYSFQLGPVSYCTEESGNPKTSQPEESYPRVIQESDHVTVIDQPVGTCDVAGTITKKKVRSPKCLYLWQCGLAR